MSDVAKLAQVSIQTVSAVINDKPGITDPTRLRVRQAIAELDYHPNFLASSLRAQRSYTIGVVIPSITNPFFPEFVRGVEDAAQRNGYSLFLCNSDDNEKKEIDYLRLLHRHRVAGLISAGRTTCPEELRVLFQMLAQHIPVVLMGTDRPHPKIVAIGVNNEQSSYRLTSHLLTIGHRRIGMIMPPAENPVREERVQGFRRAHLERGLRVQPSMLVAGGFDVCDGQRGADALLKARTPPTAIVAANDLAAIGVLDVLNQRKISVPEEMAVVGFDNIRMADLVNPSLTTIAQPVYQMGEKAMDAILSRIRDPSLSGESLEFPTELILRKST